MVFVGGQGIGTLLWGLLAAATGTRTALLVATGLLLLGAASLARRPIWRWGSRWYGMVPPPPS